MATIQPYRRHPFLNKTPYNGNTALLAKSFDATTLVKRPRSPDHNDQQVAKRVRSNTSTTTDPDKRRRAELENEFKTKYRQSFPSWKFYFDEDHLDTTTVQPLKSRILKLGGTIEGFFSAKITHIITDQPKPNGAKNKENQVNGKNQSTPLLLGSPIKLNSYSLLDKALEYGQKIWDSKKLDSVTSRCLNGPLKKSHSAAPSVMSRNNLPRSQAAQRQTLERLLLKERIHGTSERDPNQKRHDYRYFSKGSIFVLIEDIRGELSTLAIHEYPAVKDKEKPGKTPWPVLHCNPQSRNPFAPLEERDKRRWERAQQAKRDQALEHAKRKRNEQDRGMLALRRGLSGAGGRVDLRRAVSMGNLRRQHTQLIGNATNDDASGTTNFDADDDFAPTAKASGFLPSGQSRAHIAASGNSVTITSTTGTTSAAGHLLRPNQPAGALQDRPHIVTNMRTNRTEQPLETTTTKGEPTGQPSALPPRVAALKKSKSTNTLKLPKRDEGTKPGYCENCRTKFDDFTMHIDSRKHRRFAECAENFAAVDAVLAQLQRRTPGQVRKEEEARNRQFLEQQLAERKAVHRSH